jgi:amidophosphoribosyltransferase
VHVRVTAPPFLYPCYYGTDIDSSEHLIAYKYSVEEICRIIGADSLGYLSVRDVVRMAENGKEDEFCIACFDGNYPTEVPSNNSKDMFEDHK